MRSHKLLYMTGKSLKKAGKEIIFKPHGLTVARFMILYILEHRGNGTMSTRDLQKHLDVSSANMTGRIDVLERDHFVARSVGRDRRTQTLTLTDAGKRLLTTVEALFEASLNELYADFSEKEVRANIAFMTKMLKRLSKEHITACKHHLKKGEENT